MTYKIFAHISIYNLLNMYKFIRKLSSDKILYPLSKGLIFVGGIIMLAGFYNLLVFDIVEFEEQYKEVFKNLTSVLSGFSASIFILIWRHLRRTNSTQDKGLLFLAGAILVWGFLGVFPPTQREYISEYASGLNNLLILLSLYYFDDGGPNYDNYFFKILRIKKENYKVKVFVYSLFILALIIILQLLNWANLAVLDFSPYVDLGFSAFTVMALGLCLWDSFQSRDQLRIAIFSTFAVFIMFVAQFLSTIPELNLSWFENSIPRISFLSEVSLLMYKFLLMIVFGALSITWLYSRKLNLVEFDRKDMLHMARNILKEFKQDLDGQQEKFGENADLVHQTFFIENIARIEALRDVFDELYLKKYSYTTGNIDLEKYINRVLNSLKSAYPKNKFITKIELGSQPILVRADSATGLAKIMVESIANSFKHGEKWVSIEINYQSHDERINIRILDKGKFDKDVKSGFGLKAIDQFLKTLDGKFTFEPLPNGEGNEFNFNFPLTKFY